MKKISRKDLQGLRQQFPVLSREEMKHYVGGYGNGYSGGGFGDDWFYHGFGGYDPDGNFHWYSGYTQEELDNWEGPWPGGWVYGLGYVAPDTNIYGYYPGGNSYMGWENDYPEWGNSEGYPGNNGYPGFDGYYGTYSGLHVYTYQEYLNWPGPWPGGVVEGMGYVLPDTVIIGHQGGGGNPGGIISNNNGPNNNDLNNNDPYPNPNTNNPPTDDNMLTTIADVLLPSDFHGYLTTDPSGCQNRCKEMLAAAGAEMSNRRITIVENNDGKAGKASADAQKGIDEINKALNNGDPIIVGVDYKKANYNEGITDHFIIIVGRTVTTDSNGNQIIQYHYYDPAATRQSDGTSDENVLTLKDGRLVGTYRAGSDHEKNYTVSSVRPNK